MTDHNLTNLPTRDNRKTLYVTGKFNTIVVNNMHGVLLTSWCASGLSAVLRCLV